MVLLDRRRHRSISGEVEELTSQLSGTLKSSELDPPVELRTSSPRRHQPNRTLSDSAAVLSTSEGASPRPASSDQYYSPYQNGGGGGGRPDLTAGLPPVPPPRVRIERRKPEENHSPPRLSTNGLPPTPKVHMGACFMKVSYKWV